ncbi:MAG: N-formylglutamate amidohydrolase, partial [Caulobacteraceae bacterium]|nr:N-formylglutamate amidohydrolase [Caulobacteraceae bacterium]
EEAREAHGACLLVDWHSMPAAANGCDGVLGDRFGGACAPALSRLIDGELKAMGYDVARNVPYAGGYTTEHYGRPGRKVHALQIEVNRALYLDEATLTPTSRYASLKAGLERLFAFLAEIDWSRI